MFDDIKLISDYSVDQLKTILDFFNNELLCFQWEIQGDFYGRKRFVYNTIEDFCLDYRDYVSDILNEKLKKEN